MLNLSRQTANLRRPERARNEGSTGPTRLDNTRYTMWDHQTPAVGALRRGRVADPAGVVASAVDKRRISGLEWRREAQQGLQRGFASDPR